MSRRRNEAVPSALFERPRSGERALLVHVDLGSETRRELLEELRELARSAGAEPVGEVTGRRREPDPRYFIGAGKAEEVRAQAAATGAELILVNHALSPSQERNLERLVGVRVLDRVGLILDIFAQRARTFEGKLQVELAQLRHLSTRLVRGWTHLERQKGGIGLRGPGETQLETDRRMIRERMRQISARLERVRARREQGRRARRRAELPVAALVGYTNAGKSTLFNRLTGEGVHAADQLFATLDPTLRRIELGRGRPLLVADTVGFIRHLPHELVAAFRSTLEETAQASVLIHVIDASAAEREDQAAQVEAVLEEIGAADVPQVEVYNKIDRLGLAPRLEEDPARGRLRVWLSARTGAGLDLLREVLARQVAAERVRGRLALPAGAGRLRARLFALGAVCGERVRDDGGWELEIDLERSHYERLRRREGLPEARTG
ncbi:ribosome rescue GTPase HflX [Inmirania thermothiophila]|uniref:GTPase HflX n=1 Tax=Inmirania thermothiophila TaxID=1750597 RepID=A0A3N1XZN3_9GAMM|nr:ribosome rescue GTPase HflX [Inmirania thermothiophila]ROR32030.1 GTP-binding protein HflX [Inmirania thermothiophila]